VTGCNLALRERVALRAAKKADALIRSKFRSSHRTEAKGRYDFSIDVDRDAGALIAEELGAFFPGEGLVMEDSARTVLPGKLLPKKKPDSPDCCWIVDPLDGTVNYAHGLPWYCISISCWTRAVQENPTTKNTLPGFGTPLVSVVSAPGLGLVFAARADKPARSGRAKLLASHARLEDGILSFSRGSKAEDQKIITKLLASIGSEARKTRSYGASALDLAYVASGSFVCHVQRSVKVWDVAAGLHLVLAAGGFAEATSGEGPYGCHVLAGSELACRRVREALS